MFLPFGLNCIRVDEVELFQGGGRQEIACPLFEWATEPTIDGHTKSHLRTVNQSSRDMAIKELAQEPFAFAVAHLLAARQAPGKLDDAVVEDRYARLE